MVENLGVRTVDLERFHFVVQQEISREVVDVCFANPPQVDVFAGHIANTIRVRLIQDVLGQQLDRVQVWYPANWREAVKEAFYSWCGGKDRGHWPWFGDYARRRWPVRLATVTVDVKALYPLIALPRDTHRVHVAIRQTGDWRTRWSTEGENPK